MEELYNEVYDYLQECVNEDIYTEEYANTILDIAYERYMLESKGDSKNTTSLLERVKKNKKKIIALIAISTALIIAIKKYREKNKTIKQFELFTDMITENLRNEKKELEKLKSQNMELEVKVKQAQKQAEEELKRAVNAEDRAERYQDRDRKLMNIDNLQANITQDRLALGVMKNSSDSGLMKEIITLEKSVAKKEKELESAKKEIQKQYPGLVTGFTLRGADSYNNYNIKNWESSGVKIDKSKFQD